MSLDTEPTPRPKDMTVAELNALPDAHDFEYDDVVIDTQELQDKWDYPLGHTIRIPKATRMRVHICAPDDICFWVDENGMSWTPALVEDPEGNPMWAKRHFP